MIVPFVFSLVKRKFADFVSLIMWNLFAWRVWLPSSYKILHKLLVCLQAVQSAQHNTYSTVWSLEGIFTGDEIIWHVREKVTHLQNLYVLSNIVFERIFC